METVLSVSTWSLVWTVSDEEVEFNVGGEDVEVEFVVSDTTCDDGWTFVLPSSLTSSDEESIKYKLIIDI